MSGAPQGLSMENALIIGLSQQTALQRDLDIIAHNLANMNTNAYKAERPLFHTYLASIRDVDGRHDQAKMVNDIGMTRDMSEGALKTTSNPFDLAVNGKGYFVINTPAGERYTRNGHFTLDSSGQIVTEDGNPVMGDGGAITITNDDGDIHVGGDGTISGRNGQIGKLRVAGLNGELAMKKEGASLYTTSETLTTPADFKISQGALESSNVQPVVEISHMIEIMRAYQATATMTQSQEDLMRQAIDKLGAQPGS